MTVAITPHRGALRIARGAALAAVNAALAVAAHAAAGGGAPDGALTLLAATAVAAAGTALADRRRGLVAMTGAVALSQVVMHLLLDGLGTHHAVATGTPGAVAMTAAHALAVLITAALLTGAESTLFSLAAGVRRIAGLLILLPHPAPREPEQRCPVPADVPLPTARYHLLGLVAPRRGPPMPC